MSKLDFLENSPALNAAARNLMVHSFLIIVFFAGGGKLTQSDGVVSMRILGVLVTFCNQGVIYWLPWVMLAWFAVKYTMMFDSYRTWECYKDQIMHLRLLDRWLAKECGKTHLKIVEFPSRFFYQWDFYYKPLDGINSKYSIRWFSWIKKIRLILSAAQGCPIFIVYYIKYIFMAFELMVGAVIGFELISI